jgi:hypothetical protein
MPRYFFHVRDGGTTIHSEGVDLPDQISAREEAIRTCGEMLREVPASVWSGIPWSLWVTDQPDGAGERLFTLNVFVTAE